MRRGTTPTVNIVITDDDDETMDLSEYVVYLTIKDLKGNSVDFTNDRMIFNEDYSIDITLTQEETLTFKGKQLSVQIRAIDSDDVAIASDIITTKLEDILKEGVIAWD